MGAMTHYMELLAANQPWNLLIFMAGPVILAETLAITELYLLYTRRLDGSVRTLNKAVGAIAGVYFTVIFFYLLIKVFIPLTMNGGWRTFMDVIAVSSYLAGVVPFAGMALLEFGVIARKKDALSKLKLHAIFVAIFLVVAHIAMIFGMLNPDILKGMSGGHGM